VEALEDTEEFLVMRHVEANAVVKKMKYSFVVRVIRAEGNFRRTL
jgi:hypothetical protein